MQRVTHYPLDKKEPINFIGVRKITTKQKLISFCSKYNFKGSQIILGQWRVKRKIPKVTLDKTQIIK